MIEPLDERLASYFYFHGVKGALLQQLDRRAEARKAFDRGDFARPHPGRGPPTSVSISTIWTRKRA